VGVTQCEAILLVRIGAVVASTAIYRPVARRLFIWIIGFFDVSGLHVPVRYKHASCLSEFHS